MGIWDDDDMVWCDFTEIVVDRDVSYLLTIENENIWLPKSQVKVDETLGIVGIPRWLAKSKGLTED